MRTTVSVALGVLALTSTAAAASPRDPFVIGSASASGGQSTLVITLTEACHRHDLVQVVAAQVGANGGKITAIDSRGQNHYQAGGGAWKGLDNRGAFLATTSPAYPFNFGLGVGVTITVTYSKAYVWKAAIAECVPGVEIKTGSADNKSDSAISKGKGKNIRLDPPSRLHSFDEPLFVATILDGDSADTWTESPAYKTLYTLQNGSTLNLAFQRIKGKKPSNYAAENSAERVWSSSERSYKVDP